MENAPGWNWRSSLEVLSAFVQACVQPREIIMAAGIDRQHKQLGSLIAVQLVLAGIERGQPIGFCLQEKDRFG